MRIGIDIDGVLADFYSAYERLCIEVEGVDHFGVHRFPQEYPCTWNWPEHYGYSDATVKEVWRRIKTSRDFWAKLTTLPDMGYLSYIPTGAEVYFITARPGLNPKYQTEMWFRYYDVPSPTVLISDQKGLCCAALNLDKYIDDKWENVIDAAETSFATVFLIDRPYNRFETDLPIRRVKTLREALEAPVEGIGL